MQKIISDAKENKCTVFHQYCLNEYDELERTKSANKTK